MIKRFTRPPTRRVFLFWFPLMECARHHWEPLLRRHIFGFSFQRLTRSFEPAKLAHISVCWRKFASKVLLNCSTLRTDSVLLHLQLQFVFMLRVASTRSSSAMCRTATERDANSMQCNAYNGDIASLYLLLNLIYLSENLFKRHSAKLTQAPVQRVTLTTLSTETKTLDAHYREVNSRTGGGHWYWCVSPQLKYIYSDPDDALSVQLWPHQTQTRNARRRKQTSALNSQTRIFYAYVCWMPRSQQSQRAHCTHSDADAIKWI